MSGRVLVVGSVNTDMVARAARLPRAGETVIGATLAESSGGKGANAAVAVARLGVPVTLVAAVGDDERGRRERALLAAEGVDVGPVAALAGVPTGAALIVVDAAGENQIVVASGANDGLTPAHVAAAFATQDPAAVLVGFEIPDDAVREAARQAFERGLPCVVNPAPARDLALDLAPWRPVLTPNAGEACGLASGAGAAATGAGDPRHAARMLANWLEAPVVVTLGAEGAAIARPRVRELSALPAPAATVRDTTGAGDAFNGALVARLAGGDALADAAAYAVVAAALSVAGDGARDGLPDAAAVAAARRG